MRIDLHSHSSYSDGTLSPTALLKRAALKQVTVLALTDHDELRGVMEATAAAEQAGVLLVPGVEISVTWANLTLHIVGLGIDPKSPMLASGLESLRAARMARAARIAAALEANGVPDCLMGASRIAGNTATIGRGHFARYLVEQGHAKDFKTAFSRYLAKGKPAYVAQKWTELGPALQWIHSAGGRAVLAHPDRYGLSDVQLHAFLGEFTQRGGDALELCGGSKAGSSALAAVARRYGLSLSVGSDFHAPAEAVELGDVPSVPAGMRTVWQDLELPIKAA